jgi:ureidoacrylate peracid hydrolase
MADAEGQPKGEPLSFDPEDYSLVEILRPRGSALLVVDVQNDFLDPKGFFESRLGQPTEQMRSIIPHVQGLISAAHASGVPVIFTKGYEDVRFRKGPDVRRAIKWDEHDGDGSVNSESGTWGSEFYAVSPQEGDTIVEKHRWSSFDGKDKKERSLKEILDQLGVRTLVVAGVVAETCIETTIRDGYNQGYFIVVPEHSVGSNDPKQLAARMDYWRAGFVGDVVAEAEIQAIWQKSPSTNPQVPTEA